MMIELTLIEKKILNEIQKDFPLMPKPFSIIGENCEINENETIDIIKELKNKSLIREISSIINPGKIGFKSALIALKVKDEDIVSVVDKINNHSGVSHNYLRNNDYNIWFTLSVMKDIDFNDEIKKLFDNKKIESFMILPSINIFKTNVFFNFTDKNENLINNNLNCSSNFTLSDTEKKIINILQDDLSIVPEPWLNIINKLKIDYKTFFDYIKKFKAYGIIKRISAVIHHRKAGFLSNAMTCFNITDNIIEKGNIIASYNEVSHCYQRPVYDDWQYTIYAMIHTDDNKKSERIIKEISDKIKCSDYKILYGIKEFKKARIKRILI